MSRRSAAARRETAAAVDEARCEREFAALRSIGTKLAAGASAPVVCRAAARALRRTLGYEAVAVAAVRGDAAGEPATEVVARAGNVPADLLAKAVAVPGRRLRRGAAHVPRTLALRGGRAGAVLPLVSGDRPWGALAAVARGRGLLDRRALGVLSEASRILAVAFEKERLVDEARRRVEDVRFFREVSAWVVGTIDLGPLLERICRKLSEVLDVPQCFILLHDAAERILYAVAATPAEEPHIPEIRIPLSARSLAVRVFKARRPISVYDARRDPRPNRRLVRRFRVTSLLCVPLLLRGEPIGVVMLGETRCMRRFSDDERARAQAAANQAAVAIENALRHRDAVAARERTEVLLAAARDCAASEDLSEALPRVARRVVAATSATRCTIYLADMAGERIAEIFDHGTPRSVLRHVEALKGRRIEEFPAGRELLRSRRTLVYDDIAAEGGISRRAARLFRARAVIVAPVAARGQYLASIVVNYPESIGKVPPEDVLLVGGVASQIGLAILNARAVDEIVRQRHALDVLTARMIGAQEDERRRIARELHDGVSQTLTAVKFELERLGRRPGAPDEVRGAAATIGEAIGEVRQLCMDLRPSQLDYLGLAATLEWYAGSYSRRTGVPLDVDVAADLPPLGTGVEISVYRIIQEALSNVAQHAAAPRAKVRVRARGRRIHVSVADGGRGFDPAAVEPGEGRGMGLLTMRERAHLIGGELEVRSRPGAGTTVALTAPIPGPTASGSAAAAQPVDPPRPPASGPAPEQAR